MDLLDSTSRRVNHDENQPVFWKEKLIDVQTYLYINHSSVGYTQF